MGPGVGVVAVAVVLVRVGLAHSVVSFSLYALRRAFNSSVVSTLAFLGLGFLVTVPGGGLPVRARHSTLVSFRIDETLISEAVSRVPERYRQCEAREFLDFSCVCVYVYFHERPWLP